MVIVLSPSGPRIELSAYILPSPHDTRPQATSQPRDPRILSPGERWQATGRTDLRGWIGMGPPMSATKAKFILAPICFLIIHGGHRFGTVTRPENHCVKNWGYRVRYADSSSMLGQSYIRSAVSRARCGITNVTTKYRVIVIHPKVQYSRDNVYKSPKKQTGA